jgi:hypothetical protein
MATKNDMALPGNGHVDSWMDALNALDKVDVGSLGDKLDTALEALTAVRRQLWANQDALTKTQASTGYRTMAAGTDAVSKAAVSKMNSAAMDSIAQGTDMSLADNAAEACRLYCRGVELENAKQAAPAALTQSFDLQAHVQRVEMTRAVETMGATAAAEYHAVLMEQGDDKATIAFEVAAEPFMTGVVRGGSAALSAANPTKYRLNPGQADAEVGAAASFLTLLNQLRSGRKPQWLVNANDAVDTVKMLHGAMCGESVVFMGEAARAALWSGSATAKIPDPMKIAANWPTRYLTSGQPLPGWSRVSAKLSSGGYRREAAKVAADTSFGGKYRY